MKTLLLVRHAKSSWDNPSLSDFDRPLNDRGKRDAPMMAERLYRKKLRIDTFVSSPAKRARKTAEAFAERFGSKKSDIILVPELYEASVPTIFNVISKFSVENNCIALFSHNYGITEFANSLTDTRIDNMPTCSVFAVTTEIAHWEEFERASKEFYFFDFPKSMHDD
jgi:phosphohistidine phosphatase